MVALAARERHTGLPPDLASHEKAGTVLGRLWLRGRITTAMREAGERYQERHAAMRRAIKAPDGLAKGTGGGCDGDLVTEEYVIWATRAVALYEVAKAWLVDARLCSLVELVVIEDRECDPEHLRYLTTGLQILAGRMGISQEEAA